MKILITGSDGFIGKNLTFAIQEAGNFKLVGFTKKNNLDDLKKIINDDVDLIIHLAGENRPNDLLMYQKTNVGLSEKICEIVAKTKKNIPIIFSSSTQAAEQNPYGLSKLQAEKVFCDFSNRHNKSVLAIRFCGVFGKWSKPNYNSVVSTFCHNIANDIPIKITDPNKIIKLTYIDDVVEMVIDIIKNIKKYNGFNILESVITYEKKLTDIADLIKSFKQSRQSLLIPQVGTGFKRALYSTYLSFVIPEDFSYKLKENKDERGVFVEMLKTVDSGQLSFFTAHPGVTRGGHYHHSKNEKFLVIKGKARFKFKNIFTNETYEIFTSDEYPEAIDTVPGWSHDITNIGNVEMIVMLWANEIFNKDKPDTIPYKI